MEQLICKMCGGNELIKENKLYTCQHCGCKYTTDMCDIVDFSNKDNDELDVETLISSIKAEWSNVPSFNKDTDNQIFAEVTRIGHLDKEVIELELIDVFKDGYGINGCGYETAIYNLSGDRIKYFTILSVAHNHVDDKVGVNVTRFTGPIEVGDYKEYWVDGIWNDNTIGSAKIDSILFEFFNGRKVLYSSDNFNIKPTDLDIVSLTKTNKIKRCNPNTFNKIFLSARVCHEEIDFDGFINDSDAKKYIAGSGCGNFGVLFDVENISGKSINSLVIYFQAFNPVHEKVDNVKEFTLYGPMPVAFVGYAFWEIWDQDSGVISVVEILGVTVNFSDGTAEFYKKNDLTLRGRTNSKFQSSSQSEPQTFAEGFKQGFAESYSKSGGCYVATAVYGSYDCPQVWTLRRYRDYTLSETWYGRAFIKTYYAISPTLVKWFGHTNWFKNMWKGKLDRMVAKLQANGVESTPYEDKKW